MEGSEKQVSPWARWLRRHTVVNACVVALANAGALIGGLSLVDHSVGRHPKLAGWAFVWIAAWAGVVGIATYVLNRRKRQQLKT